MARCSRISSRAPSFASSAVRLFVESVVISGQHLPSGPASLFPEFRVSIAVTLNRYNTIDAGDLDPRGCILQPDTCAEPEVYSMIRKFKFEDEMHESLQ